jgi:hypothetical protein
MCWAPLLCMHQKTAQILQQRDAITAILVAMHYRVQSGLRNTTNRKLLCRFPYIALCSQYVGPERCSLAPKVEEDLQCLVSGSCMKENTRPEAPSHAWQERTQAHVLRAPKGALRGLHRD